MGCPRARASCAAAREPRPHAMHAMQSAHCSAALRNLCCTGPLNRSAAATRACGGSGPRLLLAQQRAAALGVLVVADVLVEAQALGDAAAHYPAPDVEEPARPLALGSQPPVHSAGARRITSRSAAQRSMRAGPHAPPIWQPPLRCTHAEARHGRHRVG